MTTPLHARSVLVTPAVVITSSSVATASVITTATAHNLASGDTVAVLGHIGSAPAIDGARVATVIDGTRFSIPVTVTIAGAGGTVTRTIAAEPLTLAEGKLRAGLDWTGDTARDALMMAFIGTARAKVESDTGLALLTQTRDVTFDALPSDGSPILLPSHSRPLQAVASLTTYDVAGTPTVLDASTYLVDLAAGRIGLASASSRWPTGLRAFQAITIRLVAGWTATALLPPPLVHAIGLLTAHYATLGRDLATLDVATEVPFGYEDAIAPFRVVSVA